MVSVFGDLFLYGKICSDTASAMKTIPAEPVSPSIRTYANNWELNVPSAGGNSLADSLKSAAEGGPMRAAISAFLKGSSGRLQGDKQVVHVQLRVPVSRLSIADPVSACRNSHLRALTDAHAAKKLDNETIDMFLITHGTHLAPAVILGGQLDVLLHQTKAA